MNNLSLTVKENVFEVGSIRNVFEVGSISSI